MCDLSSRRELEGFAINVGQIPKASVGETVADVLQQREKFPETRQYAHFRNNTTFPTHTDLPGEDDINKGFYDAVDEFRYMP